LLCLLAALAVRQSLGRTTILLNQSCVQGREAREVAHRSRARHRIVAAQDYRQGAALRMHAIQHAQSARERVRLTGALALELPDLAPEALDLGLRPLDAPVQARDLALLGGQPALDLFELGQERRLARARGRDALLFLPQLLLRLLELSLLR